MLEGISDAPRVAERAPANHAFSLSVPDHAHALEGRLDALFVARRFASRARLKRDVQAAVKAAMHDMATAIVDAEATYDADIVGPFGTGLARLAEGNLAHRISTVAPRFAKLQHDFNKTADRLCRGMDGLAHAARIVSEAVQDVDSATGDLALRMDRQAGSLGDAVAAIGQATGLIDDSVRHAARMERLVQAARDEVADARCLAHGLGQTVAEMAACSGDVVGMVDVIDGIAFHTNLLALNAGIEAARAEAGGDGAGFAIVATEVRALSRRTAEVASEIRNLVGMNGQQVARGVAMAAQVESALGRLVERVEEIAGLVADVAQASAMQAHSLADVSGSLGEMASAADDGAVFVQRSEAAARRLATEALRLSGLANVLGGVPPVAGADGKALRRVA